ncbi:MAG TPA: hypothetical protein VGD79_01650 [Thermoanaerobaculia bacterium]|jgi:hypothetical protein
MSLFNRETYYSLTVTAQDASTGAFYALTPTSALSISQGGATLYPSEPSQQMISVSVYPQTLQINAAAGTVTGGVNIITSAAEIAGRVVVSPPVNVAVVVTLYGNGGVQLGQSIVDPGVGSGVFVFPVNGEGIPPEDAPGELQKLLEKK